jgi:hypothetical protein
MKRVDELNQWASVRSWPFLFKLDRKSKQRSFVAKPSEKLNQLIALFRK